jgi:dephospho-CoA kinase
VLDAGAHVDRRRLAEIVFRDLTRRRDLEAQIHPLVRREIASRFG